MEALKSDQSVHEVEIQPTLVIDNNKVMPWLFISSKPVMIDGDKHVLVAINDDTERKQAEEKLKETMEIKAQFISTVSHELRTPLACMREGVNIVLEGVAGKINKKQKNFLDIAKRNIDRLSALVNDVLDFQKLQSGKMEFNMEENDIKEIIKDAYNTMLPAAKQKEVGLFLEFENDIPRATFASNKIIQVLTNLMSNAIKFTPEKGKVTVCARCKNEDLAVSISDTGMGIPQEDLLKVFERFYRVNLPGKQIKGTGLGLAIAYKIVTIHGGRFEVESELGKGTTFTFYLPIKSKPAKELSVKENEAIEEEAAISG